jgi:hypothetical protein
MIVDISFARNARRGRPRSANRSDQRSPGSECRPHSVHVSSPAGVSDFGTARGSQLGGVARQVEAVRSRDRVCIRCGSPGLSSEVHHVVPLVCGGSNRLENLELVCRPCHGRAQRR